ncbi:MULTISPECIES: hypothetical protein [Prauserella salsuginis group]|uniref:Uncharacterized protein n=1 Tax=Prauserella salsuginis TaxID=387889 RepID=A0ABW6GB52_9PSEU|nr:MULTISPECIES: hypothetical protein [Prauserella salsuginis group]MCR3722406.1 hypothetical protein [Prauserella flava]MCR3736848.1 hypothetical protein [Prauserella salsuginis]
MSQRGKRRTRNADPQGVGPEARTWGISLGWGVLWALGAALGAVGCIVMSIAVLDMGDAARLMLVFWIFAVVCGLIAWFHVSLVVVEIRVRRKERARRGLGTRPPE